MSDIPGQPTADQLARFKAANKSGGAGAFFSRKLGPLPVGVWILAIGGGLGLSYFIQRGSGDEDTFESEDNGTDFDQYEGDPYTAYAYDPFNPQPFSGAVGLPDFGTIGAPIQQPPQTIVSNAQWEALGTDYLIGIGSNSLQAKNSLTKYLEGEPLTDAERSLVTLVIRFLGVPPEGAPTLEDPDTPTPTDPPPTDEKRAWGANVPVAVREKFGPGQVFHVLKALGVPRIGKTIGLRDIRIGLEKLGWKGDDTKTNVKTVTRLVNLQKAKPTDKDRPPPRNIKFASGVPRAIRRNRNPKTVWRAIFKVNGTRSGLVVHKGEIERALRKLGYRKAPIVTNRNVGYLIRGRRAKKGE